MNNGNIIIISGPSGSGKTTLYKKLLKQKGLNRWLVKSISATTRLRRKGERSGRDYLFLSKRQFLERIKAGRFLEWQKVFDNYYGTPKKNVEQLLGKGKDVLLCIDVKGARVVRKLYPQALTIFINVPSLAVLKKRLKGRGSESRADLKKRLDTARQEMKEAKRYDYVVVNRDLEKAYQGLKLIVTAAVYGCCQGCHCGKR